MLSRFEILALDETGLLDKIVEEAAEIIHAALKMKTFGATAIGATFKTYDNLGQVITEYGQCGVYVRELSHRAMRLRDFDSTEQSLRAMIEDDGADERTVDFFAEAAKLPNVGVWITDNDGGHFVGNKEGIPIALTVSEASGLIDFLIRGNAGLTAEVRPLPDDENGIRLV